MTKRQYKKRSGLAASFFAFDIILVLYRKTVKGRKVKDAKYKDRV